MMSTYARPKFSSKKKRRGQSHHATSQQSMQQTPGIPLELVRSITGRSRLLVPLVAEHASKPINVESSGKLNRRLWFKTNPLKQFAEKLVSLRLSTYCKHQGYAEYPELGSYSWFEVAVLSDTGIWPKLVAKVDLEGSDDDSNSDEDTDSVRIKKRDDGTPLSWIVHRIPVNQKGPYRIESRLDANNELLKNIKAGNAIGVFVCAQFMGWECHGQSGVLTLEGRGDL